MLDLLFVALFQAASGAPALAPPAAAPAASDQQPQADEARRHGRRCRYVRITGSYIRERVCTTAREDELRALEAQQDLESVLNRPNLRPNDMGR